MLLFFYFFFSLRLGCNTTSTPEDSPAKLPPSSSLFGVCVPLVASLYQPALLNVADDIRSMPMSENSLLGVPGSSPPPPPPPLTGARRRDMSGFGVRSMPWSSTTCVVFFGVGRTADKGVVGYRQQGSGVWMSCTVLSRKRRKRSVEAQGEAGVLRCRGSDTVGRSAGDYGDRDRSWWGKDGQEGRGSCTHGASEHTDFKT